MKSVLLIDDDHVSRFLCTKVLERIGSFSEIYDAANGQKAINWLSDNYQNTGNLPDFILLDLNMPIMDGFAFLEAFKKLNIPEKESIRIVIVTSSDDVTDIKRAKEMGVPDYFTKPVSEDTLKNVLLTNHL